jgi:hypothetical protein
LLLKKSNWLEGIQVKTIMDDGAKRAFAFLGNSPFLHINI